MAALLTDLLTWMMRGCILCAGINLPASFHNPRAAMMVIVNIAMACVIEYARQQIPGAMR